MKLALRVLLAGALVLTVGTFMLLPHRTVAAVPADFAMAWPVARGAYHVHSSRSDGTGTVDEIAAAAARAGLQFVIITDHGNGRREPDAPSYRSGVLCIDGVEISTEFGHYVALGLPRTPYPLAGHPREVIEDVRRFGGFGFAAHPGSPNSELRWSDWDAPFDGLEWLNADSEWRDEFWTSLGRVLLTYAFRPVETLGGLLDRPGSVLEQWDRLTMSRRIPAVAGADAHARLGFRQSSDPYQDRVLARLPGYDVSFRAFVNHVILDRTLTRNAAADAALVMSALHEGRVFTSIDGIARLTAFEAIASSGSVVARPGEYITSPGPVAISARIAAPPGTRLSVVRNGVTQFEVAAPAMRVDVGREPGAYRVEAHLPAHMTSSNIPWVLSNPIYVGLIGEHERAARRSVPPVSHRTAIETWLWRAEASDGSSSALDVVARMEDGTPALEWNYALAGGPKAEQYAAIRFPVEQGLQGQDRLQLRVRGDGPKRIWVQVRAPGPAGGERWGRTFYIDKSLAPVDLRFEDFRPLGQVSSARPPLGRVDSLLLVVDTLNNEAGAKGRIWFTDLWLAQ